VGSFAYDQNRGLVGRFYKILREITESDKKRKK
jgi:hypothetical protein